MTTARQSSSQPAERGFRHGRLPRSRAWKTLLGGLGAALAVVLVSVTSVAAIALTQRYNEIDVVQIEADEAPPPQIGAIEGGFNILIVGSDTRVGQSSVNDDHSAELNDVTMLMHVSEDHSHAVVVSFPRDMVVPIPSCPTGDGGYHSAMSAQPINVTLGYGGLPCTVLTVQELTGLQIQYAGLLTFDGVIEMSTAVGGVEVCTTGPIIDPRADLYLPEAGPHNIEGETAIAFLRSRYAVGDRSDLTRIDSQQVFMSSLLRKVTSEETLTDIPTLYRLAGAATRNMQLSENFRTIPTMAGVALALAEVPLDQIAFVQYPSTTGVGGVYAGRVAPIQHQADELFEKIRNDEPFIVAEGSLGRGAAVNPDAPEPEPTSEPEPTQEPEPTEEPDPSQEPEPESPGETPQPEEPEAPPTVEASEGFRGMMAADQTCTRAN